MAFLRTILMILTLRCSEASQLLSRREDSPLAAGERLALRLHLLICGPCRRFHQFLSRLRLTIREFTSAVGTDADDSVALTEAGRARIQDALQKNSNFL